MSLLCRYCVAPVLVAVLVAVLPPVCVPFVCRFGQARYLSVSRCDESPVFESSRPAWTITFNVSLNRMLDFVHAIAS